MFADSEKSSHYIETQLYEEDRYEKPLTNSVEISFRELVHEWDNDQEVAEQVEANFVVINTDGLRATLVVVIIAEVE